MSETHSAYKSVNFYFFLESSPKRFFSPAKGDHINSDILSHIDLKYIVSVSIFPLPAYIIITYEGTQPLCIFCIILERKNNCRTRREGVCKYNRYFNDRHCRAASRHILDLHIQTDPKHTRAQAVRPKTQNKSFITYPGWLKVRDGRVMAVVTGLFLSTEHIIEFQLPCASTQH